MQFPSIQRTGVSANCRQRYAGWRNNKKSNILNNLTFDLWVCHCPGLGISECQQQDEDDCLDTICHLTIIFSCGFMDGTLALHVMQKVIKQGTAGDGCPSAYVKVIVTATYSNICALAALTSVHQWENSIFCHSCITPVLEREFSLFPVLV